MAEGQSNSSRFGRGPVFRTPDLIARTDSVLENRPKETRPTLMRGIRNLVDRWNNYIGNQPQVLYPDSQAPSKIAPKGRVHGNSTTLEIGSSVEASNSQDTTK